MTRKLGTVLALVLALTLIAPAAPARDIGKDIERGLGSMVASELESTYGVTDDPLLTDWVDRLGQKLAAVSGRTDVKYRFRILNSDEINAVAAPGGFVYVNRGTLRFVRSEDELAAVMGHEVGHVAGKHALKQLTAQILSALAIAGFQSMHAHTLSTAGSLAGGLALLKFGRDEENDADRRGLKNAVAAGYDGQAMLTFFRRLESTEKEKPGKLELYFLDHPPTDERIKRISHEPGTEDTSANAAALGGGYAERSLYREAADAYRRALQADTDNIDLKYRLAESLRHAPHASDARPITPEQKAQRLKQLSDFGSELDEAQRAIATDRKSLNDAQRGTDEELETAARSLSSVTQFVSKRNPVQYRQFLRMANSFDHAVRAGGNLRTTRDMMEETLDDLSRLKAAMQEAVERGDGAAADQVESLTMVGHSMLKNLTAGVKLARERAGGTKDGAHTLRLAAESLATSYRMPLGYTAGQFDILDLQVSTALDSLGDAANATHKAMSQVARARLDTLVARMNYLTRSVVPEDPAVNGIVSHYLGVEPEAVHQMRAKLELGGAALALARDRAEELKTKKKAAADTTQLAGFRSADPRAKEALQPENASILFSLMVHDLERELGADKAQGGKS